MYLKTECGTEFQIDESDYSLLTGKKFRINADGYVVFRLNNRITRLHRFLTLADRHLWVDHKNHDRLDNQRNNLRVCTPSQNGINRRKITSRAFTSHFKGVQWSPRNNKWLARGKKNGTSKYLGLFVCEADAATAYNFWAHEVFGEYAMFNKPKFGSEN